MSTEIDAFGTIKLKNEENKSELPTMQQSTSFVPPSIMSEALLIRYRYVIKLLGGSRSRG